MILVTGGTGLLGGHLLYHLLKKGKVVRALYRSEESKETTREIFSYYPESAALYEKINWVKGDVLDVTSLLLAMEGIAEVYHCAATVSYDPADHDLVMKINIEGTTNMVNMALEANIYKFCYVSSVATFGRSERNEEVTEKTHWENSITPSIYAISKYHAEMEVWRAREEGLNVIVVNPAVILGSGNWDKGSSSLFKRTWTGLPYYTQGVNGYVDVLDVVTCMIALMDSPVKNDIFLLVGENLSFEKVLNTIADALEKKRPHIKVNRFLATLARLEEAIRCKLTGKKPFITTATVNVALDKQYYSSEKVKKTLDFEFTPVEQTISRVARDFKCSLN